MCLSTLTLSLFFMNKNPNRLRLFLRIIGTLSIIIFFVSKALEIDNKFTDYLLILSVLCFSIIILYPLIKYLKNNYFVK